MIFTFKRRIRRACGRGLLDEPPVHPVLGQVGHPRRAQARAFGRPSASRYATNRALMSVRLTRPSRSVRPVPDVLGDASRVRR